MVSHFFAGHFVRRCCLTGTVLILALFTAMPLWAQEIPAVPPENEAQVWVLPYAAMLLFFALVLGIMLRPTKRSDSAFSYDEQLAQKEEEMKKMKGGH